MTRAGTEMKCPKCEANNPDEKEYCGDCGKRLNKHPSKFKQPLMKSTALIVTIIVVLIVTLILFGYITNPVISPLSSIHDSDGDRVADSMDKAPLDSEKWANATGKIIVSITNDDNASRMSFSIYLNGTQKISGFIEPDKTVVATLTLDWIYGNNPTKTCSVILTYASADQYKRTMLPVHAETIQIDPDQTISLGTYYT
jgi:predicted nucleic acid-binding Zn ribbon protein